MADDTVLRRGVAIKRPSGLLGTRPQWITRLRREAIALAAVNHPNVVTIHAVGEGRALVELRKGAGLPHAPAADGASLQLTVSPALRRPSPRPGLPVSSFLP